MAIALFVSDIHIVSPDCPRGRLFERFLRSLDGGSNVTHLYLLGDIFDLWVADHRYFVKRYRIIIDEIRRLKDEGVEIGYFEGNHDLHLRPFWHDELGLDVHDGPAYVRIGTQTVRLEHGDQMDPTDTGYRFLRWFLRTPPVRWLVCRLPGGLVARIGANASQRSREYTSQSKTIERNAAINVIRTHARRAFADRPFDIILSGHVHVRDDYRYAADGQEFRSINLGSWMDAPCYFRIDDDTQNFCELEAA